MDHLPPWLRNLPLPPQPPSRRGAADPAPSWLQGGAAAAPEHAPDWLLEEPTTPPPPASRSGDSDSVPAWLRDLQQEGALAEQASPPASTMQPDWLADLSSPQAEQGGDGTSAVRNDTPDWLRDLDAEQAPSSGSTPAKPKPFGATQWLDSLAAGATPPPAPPVAKQLPSELPKSPAPPPPGLGGDTYSTTTSSRIRMPVGATDWLRSIGQETDDEPPAKDAPKDEPAASAQANDDVPDWLRDISAEELAQDMIVEPGPEAQAPAAKPLSIFDPSAPGWLGDDDSFTAERTVAADDWRMDDVASSGAETMAADGIPDWLGAANPPIDLGKAPAAPGWLTADSDDESSGPADDDDMPIWLRDVAGGTPAVPPAPRPPVASDDNDDGPAWLRDVSNAPPPAAPVDDMAWLRDSPPAAAAPPAAGMEDVPAWLRDDVPPPAEPRQRVQPQADAPAADDDMPAWLRTAPPVPTPSEPAPDDVPDWLRDDVPPAPPSNVPSPGLPASRLDEVPTWLREDDGQAALSGLPAPAPAGEDEGPSWLRGSAPVAPAQPDAVPAWLRSEDPLPEPTERPSARNDIPPWLATEAEAASGSIGPGDVGLPSWLRGAVDEPASPLPAPPVPVPLPAPPAPQGPPSREAPSWLFAEEDEPPVANPGVIQPERRGLDLLGGADIPAWLRVPEPEASAPSADGKALDWLSRLSGPDPEGDENESGVALAPPLPALPRPSYARSTEQVAAMGLLERLHRTPYPEAVALPAAAVQTLWQRIGLDRILYLLLALALVLAAALPNLASGLGAAVPTAPGADDLHAAIETLGPEDVVLLAYEWDAQRSGELRPLEAAVTRHLMENKVKLILVSTDPAGTLISYDLREPMRAAGYNNENGVNFGGRDYVLLGYRPGGELALRSMAQDLRAMLASDFEGRDATGGALATNFDGTPRISTINDLGLVVVMADKPQDVQAWMEQIHSKSRGVPIAFLLPSETQPLAQPYLRQPNVLHLAGEQGALAYAARTGGTATDLAPLTTASGRLNLAVVMFLLLMAGGALVQGLLRMRKPQRGGA